MKTDVVLSLVRVMANRTETDHHPTLSTTFSPVLKQVLPLDRGFDLPRWVIEQDCIIGREPDDDRHIALPNDRKVSKRHARLRVVADCVELTDLRSKNHTYVDGQQVSQAKLVDGSVLRLGNTLFVLRYEPLRRSDAPRSETALHERLLGQSKEVRALRASLSQVARSDDPVLLLGPTGTGKELGARGVHSLSKRREGPFIPVNCAAIPAHLAESALFGHVKGSFTGADRDHEGFFQQAHRGTLFLDELAELPLDLQAKLLRVLQPAESALSRQSEVSVLHIHRVGAMDRTVIDVRVIAATNADLARAVGQATFREDLLQRLDVLPVRFPTLDQRRDDILPLFLQALNAGTNGSERSLSSRVGELLLLHHWVGNVRELLNVCRRMRLLGDGRTPLDSEHLPDDLLQLLMNRRGTQHEQPAPALDPPSVPEEPRPKLNREILEQLLIKHKGNRSLVARELRRDRKTIRRRMDELGIPRSFGCPEGVIVVEGDDDHEDEDGSTGP